MKNLTIKMSQDERELLERFGNGKAGPGFTRITGIIETIARMVPESLDAQELELVQKALGRFLWPSCLRELPTHLSLLIPADQAELREKVAKLDRLEAMAMAMCLQLAGDEPLDRWFPHLRSHSVHP